MKLTTETLPRSWPTRWWWYQRRTTRRAASARRSSRGGSPFAARNSGRPNSASGENFQFGRGAIAVGSADCKIVVFLIIFFRFDPSADQTTFLTLLWLGLIKLLKSKSWRVGQEWQQFHNPLTWCWPPQAKFYEKHGQYNRRFEPFSTEEDSHRWKSTSRRRGWSATPKYRRGERRSHVRVIN